MAEGEVHDFGRAQRDKRARQGERVALIDKLADALHLRGDKPSVISAEELDTLALSSEVDQDVRNVAKHLSDLMRGRIQEVVEEQGNKEE